MNFAQQLRTARAFFNAGQLPAAEETLRRILSSEGAPAEAHRLLGIVAAKTRRPELAEIHLKASLESDPQNFDSLTWMAMVKRSLGDFAAAIALLQRAEPKDAAVYNLLGICQLGVGEAKQAESSFEAAARLEPHGAQSYHNLGLALRLQNRGEDALGAFFRAVELAPEHPSNYLQLFKQYQQLSRWTEAIESIEIGLRRHPDSSLLKEALAVAYGRLGQPVKAEAIFTSLSGKDVNLDRAYSGWLQEQGRFEESAVPLLRILTKNPNDGAAYHGLANSRTFEVSGVRISHQIESLIEEPNLGQKERMHLAYALGKTYDTGKVYERAIHAFDLANRLAYREYPAANTFDPIATLEDPKIMSKVYSQELLDRLSKQGSTSRTPIFIVGMIRSGTTLLDQIVSSHPQVDSAGEQPFWTAESDKVHRRWRTSSDAADLTALTSEYLNVLSQFSGAERITDKMPLNFRHLGLIHCAFPKAKILHMRRDPLDTALSIYFTFFGGGPNFTYHQGNIVSFYRAYLAHMEHWRSVIPPQNLLEVDYETLVFRSEDTIRNLVEFCELPWDDACLRHHESASAVSTPSRWQARQPVYTSSVAKWRNYEPWLKELLELRGVLGESREMG